VDAVLYTHFGAPTLDGVSRSAVPAPRQREPVPCRAGRRCPPSGPRARRRAGRFMGEMRPVPYDWPGRGAERVHGK